MSWSQTSGFLILNPLSDGRETFANLGTVREAGHGRPQSWVAVTGVVESLEGFQSRGNCTIVNNTLKG